jgi:NAD(P)-dependent dehydrogenase (short-subunit alcohol dehydrogenase family)
VLASVNAGVEALARTLALEFAPLRVNVVCLGFIDAGTLLPHLSGEERSTQLQELKGNALPTKRVGLPQDAVLTYLYALRNSYVTGQTLLVDGGASLL